MEISMKDLAEKIDGLRADLSATQTALFAISRSMPKEAHAQLLHNMDLLMAERADIYAALPTAAAAHREWVSMVQSAEARLRRKLGETLLEQQE